MAKVKGQLVDILSLWLFASENERKRLEKNIIEGKDWTKRR